VRENNSYLLATHAHRHQQDVERLDGVAEHAQAPIELIEAEGGQLSLAGLDPVVDSEHVGVQPRLIRVALRHRLLDLVVRHDLLWSVYVYVVSSEWTDFKAESTAKYD
jgi:hypothetical protein